MVSDERLIAVGISHHTANVEDRERFSVPSDRVPALLGRLREDGFSNEAILLSTCNRTELYTVPGHRGDMDRLARFLAESGGVTDKSIADKIYRKRDQEALRHIFRVVSSLDSLVLGEPQIVGQVKDAFRLAQQSKTAGPVLHRVMDHAMRVSKQVRTETDIAKEAVSVGRAGVELARQVLGDLSGRSALLVGAGDHGKVVARSLLGYGLDELVVANRTFERAATLADEFNGSAIPLGDVDRYLNRVDIVLCSTGAGRVLIHRDDVAASLSKRRGRSLVMIDLSVPRNIDSSVNDLAGVFRFDIDDLAQFAGRGQAARRSAAKLAEDIVEQATEKHWRQLLGEQVNRGISVMVKDAEQTRQEEVEGIASVLKGLPEDQRMAVDAMTRAIVKKVLHRPLRTVRDWAEAGTVDKAEAVFQAFGVVEKDDE
jgi:glutamyl-tRNA reductase